MTSSVCSRIKESCHKVAASKMFIFALSLSFLVIFVLDGISWDIILNGYPKKDQKIISKSKFNIALVFFMDTIFRVLLCSFMVHWRSWKFLPVASLMKLITCRFFLSLGFQLGAMAIKFMNTGTRAVIMQIQILLTGIFRYLVFKETLTTQQVIHALILCVLAIAFKIDDVGHSDDNLQWLGFILIISSCVLVSYMFVMNERVLKHTLESFTGWEKQMLFALVDIPIQIVILFFNAMWDMQVYKAEHRTWNIFEHMNGTLFVAAGIQVFFALLIYTLFDVADSMLVNVLFAAGMALTWPVEVGMGFEEFNKTRLMLLFVLLISCIGYQLEEKRLQDQKQEDENANAKLDRLSVSICEMTSSTGSKPEGL